MVAKRARLTAPQPPDPDRPLVVRVSLPDRGMCGNGGATKHELTELRGIARTEAFHATWQSLCSYYGQPDDEYDQHAVGKAQAAREVGGLWQVGRVGVGVVARWHAFWAAKPLDDDNMWRGLKSTLDGIAQGGAVRNDRQFYMNGAIDWQPADTIGDTGVTLTIAPREWWEQHGNQNAGQPVEYETARAREETGQHDQGAGRARDRAAAAPAGEPSATRSGLQRAGSGALGNPHPAAPHTHDAGSHGHANEPLTLAEVAAVVSMLNDGYHRIQRSSSLLVEATEPDVVDRFRAVCPVCHRILPAGVKVLDASPHHARDCYAVAAGTAYTKLLLLLQTKGEEPCRDR